MQDRADLRSQSLVFSGTSENANRESRFPKMPTSFVRNQPSLETYFQHFFLHLLSDRYNIKGG